MQHTALRGLVGLGYIVLILGSLVGLLICAGCGSPVQASSSFQPKHHNIPATFAEHPEGPLVYLCATQPRGYNGVAEEDHYLQYSPCPITPIP